MFHLPQYTPPTPLPPTSLLQSILALVTPFTLFSAFSGAVEIDLNAVGPEFDGVGVLSGGGGVTRLLWDYNETDMVFDAIFGGRGVGASVDIIKVEIGGQTQSTEGTEMTHMRNASSVNCDRPYEWWVIAQAQLRNPSIKVYGLSWGVPGWVGEEYYTPQNLEYHVEWAKCARDVWGVDPSRLYLGLWNERSYDIGWTVEFRSALDAAGFEETTIVAADDGGWDVVGDLVKNSSFRDAVGIVGSHYPFASNDAPPKDAYSLPQPLWTSEGWDLGKVNDYDGGMRLAQTINRNFVSYNETAMVVWCMIFSWYAPLPFSKPTTNTLSGLGHSPLTAAQPWSGNWTFKPPLVAIAHTTQFVEPGWRYILEGSGSGMLPSGASYTSFIDSPSSFSLVIESYTVSTPSTATFTITPHVSTTSLSFSTLHVWRTNSSRYFYQAPDIIIDPQSGSFTVDIEPNAIVSLTTTTGQGLRFPEPNSIPETSFPLPHKDDFESYGAHEVLAKYFCDLGGIFTLYPGEALSNHTTGRPIKAPPLDQRTLRQIVTDIPVAWETNPLPYTLIGNFNGPKSSTFPNAWDSITLSFKAMIEQARPGKSGSLGNAVQSPCNNSNNHQLWTWRNVSALSSTFSLSPSSSTSSCLGVVGSDDGYANAGLVDCGGSGVEWEWVGEEGWVRHVESGKCLDILAESPTPGADLIVYECKNDSSTNQRWNRSGFPQGQLVSKMDRQCVTATPPSQPPSNATFIQGCVAISTYVRKGAPPQGYCIKFFLSNSTSHPAPYLVLNKGNPIHSGTTSLPIHIGQWFSISLSIQTHPNNQPQTLSASLNATPLFEALSLQDNNAYGMVAIGSGWHLAQFDDFEVVPN